MVSQSRSWKTLLNTVFSLGLTLWLVPATPAFAASPSLPINNAIVTYLQNRVGSQIGSGECANVASESLRVAGGEFITSLIGKDYPNSGDYVWGREIAWINVTNGIIVGSGNGETPRAGDVIQYRNVKLSNKASYPHHTSVVAAAGMGGTPTEVFEQNIGGKRVLMRTRIDFNTMTAGWIRIYRPISKINATGRRQFTVVNRTSANQSQTLTFSGITGSMTLGAQNTAGAYQTQWCTTRDPSTKVFLATSSRYSIEVIDGAGYEIVGSATNPTIRRLSP